MAEQVPCARETDREVTSFVRVPALSSSLHNVHWDVSLTTGPETRLVMVVIRKLDTYYFFGRTFVYVSAYLFVI